MMFESRPSRKRLVHVSLAVMWIGVALGLYDTLTEPFTGSLTGLAMRVLAPISVTLLLLSRDRVGTLQSLMLGLGMTLSAVTIILLLVRVFS